MIRKLLINSFNAIILCMIFLLLSEVRCGNYKQRTPPPSDPKKTSACPLADISCVVPASVRFAFLYPDADEAALLREAIDRAKMVFPHRRPTEEREKKR